MSADVVRNFVPQPVALDTRKSKSTIQEIPMPLELIIVILEISDICDVVRCRQVSKVFCNCIDNSPRLQYRIELLLWGLEDTGSIAVPVSQKRKLLAEYVSWRTTLQPHPLARSQFALELDMTWSTSGGLFCKSTSDGIEITQLPSNVLNIPVKQWRLAVDNPYSFEVDVSQDLILVEFCDEYSFRVKALSLSTGEQHPDAICDAFEIETPEPLLVESAMADLTIMKNRVVVGIYDRDAAFPSYSSLSVMDWRTGATKAASESQITSFVLLDDTHILTSSICETVNAPKISVINSRLTSLPKIIFLFPELLVEPHHYDVELNAAPSSLSTPLVPERNRSPTFTATSDKILTLTVFDGVSNNPVFIVPSWVLQKAIATIGREIHSPSEEDIVVPWEQWGPEGTAFFPTTRLSILESTLFSVSGMLYITEENGSIVLYDFNRFALRRDASLGTTENCTIESDPNKHECETFAEPFSASLPWRKFVTPLKVEPDVTIGIVDNSVLVYRGSGDLGEGTMEVISF